MWLTWADHNLGIYEKSRVYLQELLEQIENYSYPEQLMLKTLKSEYDKDPRAGIKYSEMLLEYDPNPAWYWQLGLYYSWIRQDEKAVQFLEKALDVLQQWNVLSKWPYLYTLPGHIYHEHYLLLREIEKTINNQNK
jgi:tetratricopeptide (TPR) repeat protein